MGRLTRIVLLVLASPVLAVFGLGYGGNPDEETFDPFGIFFVFGILFVGFLILLWIWNNSNEKRERKRWGYSGNMNAMKITNNVSFDMRLRQRVPRRIG